MKTLIKLTALLSLVIALKTNAQIIIPATNVRANNETIPCAVCQPNNWFSITGTPDMSTRTVVASTATAGGGTNWNNEPLVLPTNGHTGWITIRDIGQNAAGTAEEAVGTTLSNLIIGQDYEVVVYSMTALQSAYSPNYLTEFTFRVTDEYPKVNDTSFEAKYPRTTVNNINRDTDGSWGTSRLRFRAVNSTMYLALYPGKTATYNASSTYKSVNLSITANSINTLPVAQHKTANVDYGTPTIIIDAIEGATDEDADQVVVKNSVDLDPSTDGIQKTFTNNNQGTWTVDDNGKVTFTPVKGFAGLASINYTVQDNYTLDGVASPGTSLPQSIIVAVAQPCIGTVNGSDFSVADGNTATFTMPAADYGFQFDIYKLDNSFNLEINGVMLASKELQFQKGLSNPQNIRFKDGDIWEANGVPPIYNINGTKTSPVIRIIIDPNGKVTMLGIKAAGKELEELELFNDTTFGTIVWNTTSSNTVIASQSVQGATNMSGHGSGLRMVPCFCTKPANTEVANSPTQVGISTKSNKLNNWPNVIPNGFIALESSNKGLVITRVTSSNQITDAKEGMIIYDKTDRCVKLYNGSTWKCIERGCNVVNNDI